MVSNFVIFIIFNILLAFEFRSAADSQTWIKAGYYAVHDEFPIADINSAFFTHLLCGFADLNSTSYQVFLPLSDENNFTTFTDTVKQRNPQVVTLLSIGGEHADHSIFSSMVSDSSYRKSFIDSSIKIARLYGFQGLDLSWISANTSSDMMNMGILFQEWKAATELEARNSTQSSQLILTARVGYSPRRRSGTYPVDSIQQYMDWIHVMAQDYGMPMRNNTVAHAALYDPNPRSKACTDYGISEWINQGLSPSKLVLCLPFYGYAWTLLNPKNTGVGAPAIGPAVAKDGFLTYKDIKDFIKQHNSHVMFTQTYVVNYCTSGTTWIGFDDAEAIRTKISYAKEKGLLGYYAWQVSYDQDWKLSQAAAQENIKEGQTKSRRIAIDMSMTAAGILLLCFAVYYCFIRKRKSKGRVVGSAKVTVDKTNNPAAAGVIDSNVPNLIVFNLPDIEAATNTFSIENKLGEGGYGPVYKGILSDGQEIAVKKLSKRSTQGIEEFENEVRLTAKLQHVNLVKLLGFCVDREEQMLVYEYMPNRSLDYYLFDPLRGCILDWQKRVAIIEGVVQGLLYLQEYSRLTIIHRDLKVSNVLLDEDMKPKISDFGLARIFVKDDIEANTDKIVGTLGYVPPEYVKRGIYSTKSDVFSFGILLLEIISGKKISLLYGVNENLVLQEHAYDLWKNGEAMEFMDPLLDDTDCTCKLIRCMQIALLCVQENPNDRPAMLEVSSMLKNEMIDIINPKKPAFSVQYDHEDEENKPPMQPEIRSGNEVTISEMVAR